VSLPRHYTGAERAQDMAAALLVFLCFFLLLWIWP
jgi:hypothetical protein